MIFFLILVIKKGSESAIIMSTRSEISDLESRNFKSAHQEITFDRLSACYSDAIDICRLA
jgi:hypothetical protein